MAWRWAEISRTHTYTSTPVLRGVLAAAQRFVAVAFAMVAVDVEARIGI
ncbi:MAG TPA: hypothetical protein ACN46S_09400 [Prochlorococcus sp.]